MAENVAKVTLEVGTDTSKVAGQVAAAKAQVEAGGVAVDAAGKATAATNAQTAATSRLGEQLKGVKKTYGEQIEVVQSLIGKIAAIGGIATIAFNVGKAIRENIVEALKDSATRANEFIENLDFNKPRENAAQLQQRLNEINSELAFALEQQAEALEDQRTALFVLERRASTTREVNRLQAEANQIQKRLINDLKQANAQEDEQRKNRAKENARLEDEARKRRIEEGNLLDRLDEEGRRGRQRIDDEQQRRREAFEDAQAQAAAIARAQQEAAAKVQQSWSNAYRAIREESNRAFATDQAASMVQLAAQLRMEGTVAAANMNQIIVQGVG